MPQQLPIKTLSLDPLAEYESHDRVYQGKRCLMSFSHLNLGLYIPAIPFVALGQEHVKERTSSFIPSTRFHLGLS